jgi:DNA-directed RNA polymerase delta subunit
MSINNFNLSKEGPHQLALKIIAILPSRTQDIVKKRFGLDNNDPKTLEAVGQDYKITRERIRQIIEAALKTVKKQPVLKMADVFIKQAEQILKQSGGVDENVRFLTKIDKQFKESKGNLSAIRFLLTLNPDFSFEEENDLYNSFWHFSRISKDKIYKNIKNIGGLFKKKQSTYLMDEILTLVKKNVFSNINKEELRAYLEISKKVGMNPFGEYGLFDWMEIDPSGARDRAYLIMKHSKKPLHFSDITKRLNECNEITIPASVASHSWQKKVCIQTVHNELIRDSRFVLIGRGIYALGEWGYKPGKIVNVIKDILKEAGKPLKQEAIIKEVKKRRMAKDNTIILNLHNKKYFKKLPNKYYSLVRSYKILEV